MQSQLTVESRGFWDNHPLPPLTQPVWYPFMLTTTDETFLDPEPWLSGVYNINCALRNNVMCMRTKSDANHTDAISAYSGGKLALYSKWVLNPSSDSALIVDGTRSAGGTIVQDYEYYDYLNYINRTEVSYIVNGIKTVSDYQPAFFGLDSHNMPGSGAGAKHLLNLMAGQFGNLKIQYTDHSTAANGIVATMLTRTLTGVSGSLSLSTYTTTSIQAWYNWLHSLLVSVNSTCTT